MTVYGFRATWPEGWDSSAFKTFDFKYERDNAWIAAMSGEGADMDCCGFQTVTFCGCSSTSFRLYMIDNWGYGRLTIQYLELLVGMKLKCMSRGTASFHATPAHSAMPRHATPHYAIKPGFTRRGGVDMRRVGLQRWTRAEGIAAR